jgi:hypothetical protein
VEVRVAAQALDSVGTDIQAVDFITVVTQQALGQVVTDEKLVYLTGRQLGFS